MSDQRIVATLDLFNRKNKRKVAFLSVIASLALAWVFSILLSGMGRSPYWLILAGVALIPTTLLHEGCHYLFQWRFSRRKPGFGFRWPYPYSALAPFAYTTRNQGVLCCLAPFLMIPPVVVLVSLSMNQLPRMLFWALASFETVTCFGDFLTVNWLRKYPRHLKWGCLNRVNVLVEIVPNEGFSDRKQTVRSEHGS